MEYIGYYGYILLLRITPQQPLVGFPRRRGILPPPPAVGDVEGFYRKSNGYNNDLLRVAISYQHVWYGGIKCPYRPKIENGWHAQRPLCSNEHSMGGI